MIKTLDLTSNGISIELARQCSHCHGEGGLDPTGECDLDKIVGCGECDELGWILSRNFRQLEKALGLASFARVKDLLFLSGPINSHTRELKKVWAKLEQTDRWATEVNQRLQELQKNTERLHGGYFKCGACEERVSDLVGVKVPYAVDEVAQCYICPSCKSTMDELKCEYLKIFLGMTERGSNG